MSKNINVTDTETNKTVTMSQKGFDRTLKGTKKKDGKPRYKTSPAKEEAPKELNANDVAKLVFQAKSVEEIEGIVKKFGKEDTKTVSQAIAERTEDLSVGKPKDAEDAK